MECDVGGGRMWVVEKDAVCGESVLGLLGSSGECVMAVSEEGSRRDLQGLLVTIERQW